MKDVGNVLGNYRMGLALNEADCWLFMLDVNNPVCCFLPRSSSKSHAQLSTATCHSPTALLTLTFSPPFQSEPLEQFISMTAAGSFETARPKTRTDGKEMVHAMSVRRTARAVLSKCDVVDSPHAEVPTLQLPRSKISRDGGASDAFLRAQRDASAAAAEPRTEAVAAEEISSVISKACVSLLQVRLLLLLMPAERPSCLLNGYLCLLNGCLCLLNGRLCLLNGC